LRLPVPEKAVGMTITFPSAVSNGRGRLGIEWSIDLCDNFTPVPDLLYVSFDKLPMALLIPSF
jgi:hypothetical protein